MKEYGYLFQGTEHEQAANKFASKVQDITEFLLALGLRVEPRYPQNLKVVYHDACHLAHAQGVTDAPRRLLASIAGIELLDMSEVNMCCGSAGTYNLEQPDIAGATDMGPATQFD